MSTEPQAAQPLCSLVPWLWKDVNLSLIYEEEDPREGSDMPKAPGSLVRAVYVGLGCAEGGCVRVQGHCGILSSCNPSHFTLTAALGGGGHYTHFAEGGPGPETTGQGTRCPDPELCHPHSALARGSESGPLGLLALAGWLLCRGYAVSAREHWCQGCRAERPVSGQALALGLGLGRPFEAQHVQAPRLWVLAPWKAFTTLSCWRGLSHLSSTPCAGPWQPPGLSVFIYEMGCPSCPVP